MRPWSRNPGCPGAEFANKGRGKRKTCLNVLGLFRLQAHESRGPRNFSAGQVQGRDVQELSCLTAKGTCLNNVGAFRGKPTNPAGLATSVCDGARGLDVQELRRQNLPKRRKALQGRAHESGGVERVVYPAAYGNGTSH